MVYFLIAFIASVVLLSDETEDYLVFLWHDTLFTHSISTGEVTRLGTAFDGFAEEFSDVYLRADAPLTIPFDEEFGFYHGIWSPDRSRFAYLEIAAPRYRLRLQEGENNQILLEGQMDDEKHLLDPIGWTENGEILLLERLTLNHLHRINVWKLDPSTLTLDHFALGETGHLNGRTAILHGGTKVFIGFDFKNQTGYLLDIPTEKLSRFDSGLDAVFPPSRGFQHYPLQVFGVVNNGQLTSIREKIETTTGAFTLPPQPAPFLHWPLPDDARSITCYPDSVWTTANFDVTCPGLARNYQGHEGTDVGGLPEGLPPGTPVYPAAIGVVVATHRDCLTDNPSCNDSYGNTVMLEHIVVVDGQAQVWYTGYAHLQTVLVENFAIVSQLHEPLALSGATGTGGAHLHFELRQAEQWVDPWDNRSGQSLWMGSNIRPLAAVSEIEAANIPQVLAVCTSITGNNIRRGPGTDYEAVAKTEQGTTYHVMEIVFVDGGSAYGDWYHVQFEGEAGWLWSGLLDCP